ncbi:carbonic anhydrase [Cyanobium sp. WAJ14-Wanaka]|uniref:carbonic anhydrase n=1 Tax=Cyanobium sp. WAJ14-Wanaka TaxID=2823725 RepID=UPI0020CBF29D|nr:carbonic anhydrase family protein [Cyanobium sp. WAJ14-Wanaka]MCP9775927.1 carbonic anhydrase family protein [Cyanobium sp. WAJ14-Wanaka]
MQPSQHLSLSLALVVSGVALTPLVALAKPQYGYSGDVAPEKWGQLSPKYAACSDGSEQAPVNIVSKTTVKQTTATALRPEYPATSGDVVNTGTTIQVNTSGNLKIGTTPYKLLQYHFHTPSEEAINGIHYAANVHLVHQNAKGQLAVIGVNFKKGAPNPYLASFWNKLPAKKGGSVSVNLPSLKELLPASLEYYTFAGSLTTPPCSEGVRFYILKQPVTISAEQLATFQKLYPMNARPLQKLNGRVIKSSN